MESQKQTIPRLEILKDGNGNPRRYSVWDDSNPLQYILISELEDHLILSELDPKLSIAGSHYEPFGIEHERSKAEKRAEEHIQEFIKSYCKQRGIIC
jgi:hypothetical protein